MEKSRRNCRFMKNRREERDESRWEKANYRCLPNSVFGASVILSSKCSVPCTILFFG